MIELEESSNLKKCGGNIQAYLFKDQEFDDDTSSARLSKIYDRVTPIAPQEELCRQLQIKLEEKHHETQYLREELCKMQNRNVH